MGDVTRDLDDTVIGLRRATADPNATAEPDEADTVVRAAVPVPAFDVPVQAGGARSGRRFGIRIGDAAAIPLDVPGIVGRRPRAPRVPAPIAPRLVTVHSAAKQVSGSHAEVRQVGETVVVTDLRSTNGTIVRMPGAAPLALRQGESAVVTPGATIDLGDGAVLEIVSLDRVTASGATDD